MAYTRKINFSGTNRYGCGPKDEDDVYTVAEFKDAVKSVAFIDNDGFGYPVRDGLADVGIYIRPSRLNLIPQDATHIVWFNR